jgi:hypothetical protein
VTLNLQVSRIATEGSCSDNGLNTQATTYTVGDLYVHAISTTADPTIVTGARLGWQNLNVMRQLWPIVEIPLFWPPPITMTEAMAEGFPGTMYEFGAQINRRRQGMAEGR